MSYTRPAGTPPVILLKDQFRYAGISSNFSSAQEYASTVAKIKGLVDMCLQQTKNVHVFLTSAAGTGELDSATRSSLKEQEKACSALIKALKNLQGKEEGLFIEPRFLGPLGAVGENPPVSAEELNSWISKANLWQGACRQLCDPP